jgi:hypothetical protein
MTDTQKPEEKKEQTFADKLKGLLKDFPNAPSLAEIEAFKAKHGDIFLSALSEDELFVFRALTRKEHRKLNNEMQEGKLAPDLYEDEVIKSCLLWTSVDDLDAKAGTFPSLMEQVMQNSNFLSSQMLTNLVTKL